MANNLTLSDVVKIITEGGMEAAMQRSDEIMEYAERVDEVATDIFNRQDREFSKGMIGMIQSLTISIMFSRGDLDLMEMIQMLDDEQLTKYSVIMMKMVVGISAMEELR